MADHPIYLVGSRFKHHAAHSGYEGFYRHLTIPLKAPIKLRYLPGMWGWRVDSTIGALARRPCYTLAALLSEVLFSFGMIARKAVHHAIYADTDLWLLPKVSRWTNNRLIATFHEPPATLGFMAVDSRIVANLAAVVLVAEAQRIYFENLIDRDRIFVVPHGVDTEFFRPRLQCPSEPICITVGSHLRDFVTLKQAMELVWQVKPEAQFVAVGLRHSNESQARTVFSGEEKRVQFFESISDDELRDKYQSARVALFSFQDATVNNAMLEAMACGLPVVATDVGGVREYLGSAGTLCPPRDPGALARGVCELLDDASLASRLAHASRDRALQFNYAVVAAQMARVYSHVLGTDGLVRSFAG
jgi:glycosyltransferase involved in cell wall biosynthesis